ncbi:hypothetical protein L1987_64720 [Smallanthus sonchifolius]|uniref:Uncharacterized protein n=1 Tax=Smallanthus sonchifolius TaxID=185202 RepID=A0ACB9BSC7_9ASTR|nr:hypothetical protein L1987_64720 [Smallanthus sonchifolius]
METVLEIQERNDAVTVIERNLKELHQVFMDMVVLVEHQGEQLDNIESHVNRANSYVTRGLVQQWAHLDQAQYGFEEEWELVPGCRHRAHKGLCGYGFEVR